MRTTEQRPAGKGGGTATGEEWATQSPPTPVICSPRHHSQIHLRFGLRAGQGGTEQKPLSPGCRVRKELGRCKRIATRKQGQAQSGGN